MSSSQANEVQELILKVLDETTPLTVKEIRKKMRDQGIDIPRSKANSILYKELTVGTVRRLEVTDGSAPQWVLATDAQTPRVQASNEGTPSAAAPPTSSEITGSFSELLDIFLDSQGIQIRVGEADLSPNDPMYHIELVDSYVEVTINSKHHLAVMFEQYPQSHEIAAGFAAIEAATHRKLADSGMDLEAYRKIRETLFMEMRFPQSS